MSLVEKIDIFPRMISIETESGWDFGVGDPELWKFSGQLYVPGGRVLDLGSQIARNSLFFALRGMSVDSVDKDDEVTQLLDAVVTNRHLPINLIEQDIAQFTPETQSYDLVIIGDVLSHLPGKAVAYEVLDRAIQAVKPNRNLWIRAMGKDGSGYDQMKDDARIGGRYGDRVEEVEEDTFRIDCTHHQGSHIDPYRLYFETTELMLYLFSRNFRMMHSQVIPQEDEANIMYGEDWPHQLPRNSFITLLAQKHG